MRVILKYYLIFIPLFILSQGCRKDDISIPAIETDAVNEITENTARSGGIILNDGGSPITANGLCWSTKSIPTITNNKSIHKPGKERFIHTITGLNPVTTYYVRAYASNSLGTGYGEIIKFSTPGLSSNDAFQEDLKLKNPSLQIIHTIIRGSEPDYCHFGFITRNPKNGRWISAFRRGRDHIGDEGKIMFCRS